MVVFGQFGVHLFIDVGLKVCLLDIDVPEFSVIHGYGGRYCPHSGGRRREGGRLVIVQSFHLAKPLGHEAPAWFYLAILFDLKLAEGLST